MARITVDDCLKRIPNRFQLTLAATYRARQLGSGATPQVEANRDKATVIALREISIGKVGLEVLRRNQAPAAAPASRVRLRVAFHAPIAQGYVMIRRNDVEIWRRAFDFGRKSGGGTLEGEVEVPSGAGEYKAWVIATDRSVNEYQIVTLTVGEGRTLALDVDAKKKLAVSLR